MIFAHWANVRCLPVNAKRCVSFKGSGAYACVARCFPELFSCHRRKFVGGVQCAKAHNSERNTHTRHLVDARASP
eukprot:11388875-Alexandrium_andersonii.AAC.1